ncbi:acetyl-CoA synthetase [Metabacillus crassostreae]|uniref:acyl-CoA synthetase MbcS n=1 Tax=Metabacillus crassostreae TaxID=929098 RepID=UPI001959689C|nr:acyl--CoA ligase [Metabacillus crassostreae]MBM7602968.1 acetyl-CoA synthetase [Metabacillus crassostreae]
MFDVKNNLIAPKNYNITHEIEKHASDKLALIHQNEAGDIHTLSYNELIKQSNKLANGLYKLGLQKGDRVLIVTTRLIESYMIYMACLKAGLVIIPSSELLRAKDIAFRLNHSEAKAVISYSEFTNEIEAIEEETPYLHHKIVFGNEKEGWENLYQLMQTAQEDFNNNITKSDDLAFLAYTSGTTGNPKGVAHTHSWGYAHIRIAAKQWLNIEKPDTVWATAAPGWQKWVWTPFLSILGSGATGFVYQGKFSSEKYLELLQEQKINVLCCTPTEYRMMVKTEGLHKFDLSSLRSAVSAGEALNREVIDVFKHTFNIQIRDGYGQTESTLLIGTLQGAEHKIGSMGKPILDGTVEIVDEEGVPVKTGEIGIIAIRKELPALFNMYYKAPEKTNRSYKGDYFFTGDRASKDEDGFYWFQGRSDDVIISSGYTIGPFEIEDALMKHPAVVECAAVASPDEVRGNVVKAFIVLQKGFEESDNLVKELQTFVKQITAPYKYPRIIEFVKSLPKTDSGKIRRVELRNNETANSI